MAISYTEIRTRVKRRFSADLSTPAINDLDNANIDGWANEHKNDVIQLLLPDGLPLDEVMRRAAIYFRSLTVSDESVTITSSAIDLTGLDYGLKRVISLSCTAAYADKSGDTVTVTAKRVRILDNPDDFNRLDSSNFIITPTAKRPVGLIAGNSLKLKPTSGLSAALLTYIRTHPTIGASQDTLFDEMGDNLLILLIVKRYYLFLEEEALAAMVQGEINQLAGGA